MYKITTDFKKNIFRDYDIRGLSESELDADKYYTIGKMLGRYLHEKSVRRVLLGFDARIHSIDYAKALTKGLLCSGIDVLDLGQIPSPVLYFGLSFLNVTSCLMVTASHNPKEYNGLKIIINNKNIDNVNIIYENIQILYFRDGNGSYEYQNITASYIRAITKQFSMKYKLKIAIDCANAVAGSFAPLLFKQLGLDVTEINCDVDGNFPNHDPDPSNTNNIKDLINIVRDNKLDFGLAFDGDADRLCIVTPKGDVISPEVLMLFLAKDFLIINSTVTVVYDIKCSSILSSELEKKGSLSFLSKTGTKYIKSMMSQKGANFGCEMSGHIIIKDKWTGHEDALYAAARLLEIFSRAKNYLEVEYYNLPFQVSSPEIKIAVNEVDKFKIIQSIIDTWQFNEGEVSYIDGLRWQTNYGWALIRASNTSSNLIVRIEAINLKCFKKIKNVFIEKLEYINLNLGDLM